MYKFKFNNHDDVSFLMFLSSCFGCMTSQAQPNNVVYLLSPSDYFIEICSELSSQDVQFQTGDQ